MKFSENYKVRSCRLNLTPENIKAGKFKVCLEYHIKRCEGPCVGNQTLENYNRNISEIIEILKGNISLIEKQIMTEMQHCADNLRFEEAHRLKEKLLLIRNFREKSQVVSNINYNLDVYGFTDDDGAAYINYLHVVNGGIIQAYTFEYKKRLDETPEELLGLGIVEMRQRFGSESKEIIVLSPRPTLTVVLRFLSVVTGESFLDLSEKNVKQFKVDKLKKAEMLNPEQRTTRILKTVQRSWLEGDPGISSARQFKHSRNKSGCRL